MSLKQERRAQVQLGHQTYFLKKSKLCQLVLAEKFKDLKHSKKLESFFSQKRRRNAGKERDIFLSAKSAKTCLQLCRCRKTDTLGLGLTLPVHSSL